MRTEEEIIRKRDLAEVQKRKHLREGNDVEFRIACIKIKLLEWMLGKAMGKRNHYPGSPSRAVEGIRRAQARDKQRTEEERLSKAREEKNYLS
jgi:hypothetical protein